MNRMLKRLKSEDGAVALLGTVAMQITLKDTVPNTAVSKLSQK